MTQVTPPGWYPDPGQTNDGPATERWWDGKAWTDQTRAAGSAAAWGPPAQTAADGTPAAHPGGAGRPGYPAGPAYPAGPGYPGAPAYPGGPAYSGGPAYPGDPGYAGYPGYPAAPAAGRRRGLRTGIAVAAAVAVLASIGVGVYALAKDDNSGGGGTAQGPGGRGGPGGPDGQDGGGSGGSGGSDGPSSSPGGSEPPTIKSGSVTDALNGISIPIPKGWSGQQLQVGVQVVSDASYKCPGDTTKTCTKGGVYSSPAEALGSKGATAEEVAKADVAANAEQSYGGTTYGAITSHQVLASKAVTVAGQKGYLVRWKAVTSKGADGYVESLAFPAPADAKRFVVLRFGLDTDQDVSVIDTITKSVKVSTGGGSGQDV
ncbi:hypothetical protein QFZ56_006585 [Streptomyces achromogenes]|uniref:DUF2510 domain-containing protein n=1 Tax=Streptomyces achromogenes TaxID=67255 RepID=A0ABU0QAD3_STRAH|nr:DUF2510 domain-containing protein [Streptomyces achromogenes]MDQ0687622.1 hypothetical protein [Streptomyces achromogenes]